MMAEEQTHAQENNLKVDEISANDTKNSSDVIEAYQLMAQGKRNIVCGEIHQAVAQFQQACELLSKKYGELADDCADAYFCYGKALLEYARADNGVLGNAINSVSSEEDADDEDAGAPTTLENQEASEEKQKYEDDDPVADSSTADGGDLDEQDGVDDSSVLSEDNSVELEDEDREATAGTSTSEENKENVEKPESGEDVSNLQLAWEMLELAKVIFSRHETKEARLKLSEIYLNLGEIGLESGQFPQAIEDLRECLHLREELLEPADRSLAETFYQLGLACTYNASYEDALLYYHKAIDVIKMKLSILTDFVKEAEAAGNGTELSNFDDPVYKARREIEDLNSILPDIVGKMEDTQDEKKNADMVKVMLRETMMTSQPDDGGCSSKSVLPAFSSAGPSAIGPAATVIDIQSKETTNISHLVRKKRKPEDTAAPESCSKKPALNNGDTVAANGDTKLLAVSSSGDDTNVTTSCVRGDASITGVTTSCNGQSDLV